MSAIVSAWTPPAIKPVERVWADELCFVLCGGASVKHQRRDIQRLQGRFIAVKEGVLLRPDADVAFFAGEKSEIVAPPLLGKFVGGSIVVRGKGHPVFPAHASRIGRTETHDRWSTDPTKVAGFDAGTSAINLAILMGVVDVVLLGYDMSGGRWFEGIHPHPRMRIPASDFDRHLGPLPSLARHAMELGVMIWNCSPVSRATSFPYRPLGDFL